MVQGIADVAEMGYAPNGETTWAAHMFPNVGWEIKPHAVAYEYLA